MLSDADSSSIVSEDEGGYISKVGVTVNIPITLARNTECNQSHRFLQIWLYSSFNTNLDFSTYKQVYYKL